MAGAESKFSLLEVALNASRFNPILAEAILLDRIIFDNINARRRHANEPDTSHHNLELSRLHNELCRKAALPPPHPWLKPKSEAAAGAAANEKFIYEYYKTELARMQAEAAKVLAEAATLATAPATAAAAAGS